MIIQIIEVNSSNNMELYINTSDDSNTSNNTVITPTGKKNETNFL